VDPYYVEDFGLDEKGLEALRNKALELVTEREQAKGQVVEDEARRVASRAEFLGCTVALVKYIESLEHRIGIIAETVSRHYEDA